MGPIASPVTAHLAVQHRRRLGVSVTPVQAARALLPRGAVLLESRTGHPGARYAYVAFHPRSTVTLDERGILEEIEGGARRTLGAPFDLLEAVFARYRAFAAPEPPFAGGWIGWLSHEAGAHLLGVPTASALPPSRPAFPLGFFRFYPDVLVFDADSGAPELLTTDVGGEERTAPERADEAERLLRRVPAAADAARARGEPEASLDRTAFEERVGRLRALVREGDCFQVNLTASYAFAWDRPPTTAALLSLYDMYAAANPGAWGAFFPGPAATLLSSSPELLADLHGARLRLRPIAGTRPRGGTPAEDARLADELRRDPKERSEHAMLVDLARNDAARLCRPGTVHVPNLGGVERYRHVMHLVSEVEGEPRPGLQPLDVLRAVFPGGTVTGAPKRRAVQRISDHERGPRGPYTGALGYVSLNGSTAWNLLIRTLVATPSHLVAHAGCGIVAGSRAPAEFVELEAKARAQIEAALGQAEPAPPSLECGTVEPGPRWNWPTPTAAANGRRVLLVDFEDSFVHNLADACAHLGAEASVWSAHEAVGPAWNPAPSHVVFSPGPGRPEDFPTFPLHLGRAKRAGTPVLGVCLGHQALAQQLGAHIVRHPETVHGRSSRVRRTPAGERDPVLGAWTGAQGARYHSLIATDLPPDVQRLAELEDGTLMAARFGARPWWGLQFHPESLLTEDGLRLLEAFLEVGGRGA